MIATLLTKTRHARVLNTISILAGGALLLVLFLLSGSVAAPVVTAPNYEATLSIGDTTVTVTIADTDQAREQGLSNTASLGDNAGKLFLFEAPGKYGFWMKDMNYALDIIWIDKDFRIVGIAKDVSPTTYPAVFYPPVDVAYVLEVNTGFSTAHHVAKNELLTFINNLSF